MYYAYMQSPVGQLLLAGDEDGLKYLSFSSGKNVQAPEKEWRENPAFFGDALNQLREYFEGHRKSFDLKLAPNGTNFQKDVLKALQKIPYGRTVSYQEIAEAVGNPKAVRAVGAANGRNPISIVIPCHRVIGKNGQLTGFGGGLDVKEKLLELEQAHV